MEYLQIVLLLVIIIILYLTIAKPALSGAPYLPISKKSLKSMIKLAKLDNRRIIAADLGSGDGKVIIKFAQKGIEAHGYEINPVLVIISKIRIKRLGLSKKGFIHWKNFFREDLSNYNVLTLYGITSIMARLEQKLKRELKPNSRIISYVFKFPNWEITETLKNNHLYIMK